MSSSVKVDTGKIVSTSKKIVDANVKIENNLSEISKAVSKLNSSWNGKVSNHAINAFNRIRNSYFDTRKDVMYSCVTYLNNVVGTGYEEAEKENKKKVELEGLFK